MKPRSVHVVNRNTFVLVASGRLTSSFKVSKQATAVKFSSAETC